METDSVIVVAGGGVVLRRGDLSTGATVVAADEGLDSVLAVGLRADVAVGDFDSASGAALEAAKAAGTRVVRHPQAKDQTDLELALDEAAAMAPRRIVVIGAADGRLDHLLGALLLLGSERYASFEIDALLGPATAHVVRGGRRFEGEPGELVSLLALHGPAEGVTTDGLAYPLRGETLLSGSSRGVSNVFVTVEAQVAVTRGVLIAVRPGPETTTE